MFGMFYKCEYSSCVKEIVDRIKRSEGGMSLFRKALLDIKYDGVLQELYENLRTAFMDEFAGLIVLRYLGKAVLHDTAKELGEEINLKDGASVYEFAGQISDALFAEEIRKRMKGDEKQ